MTSIFYLIGRTYHNKFKSNYLRNKNSFLIFCCNFEVYIEFSREMSLIAYVFPESETGKALVS